MSEQKSQYFKLNLLLRVRRLFRRERDTDDGWSIIKHASWPDFRVLPQRPSINSFDGWQTYREEWNTYRDAWSNNRFDQDVDIHIKFELASPSSIPQNNVEEEVSEDNSEDGNEETKNEDSYHTWIDHWRKLGQPWRTEPEVDKERQTYLAEHLSIKTDLWKHIYPFQNIEPKLSRADIEWLLAKLGDGRGPIIWDEEELWKRKGLDLRAANLCNAELWKLPLACMIGGVSDDGYGASPADLRDVEPAMAHLEGASMRETHLEGAELDKAHMEGAYLFRAYLEKANLAIACLEGAYLDQAHLEEANLFATNLRGASLHDAHLENADLRTARLEGADLRGANLKGARLDEAVLGDEKHVGPLIADAQLSDVNLATIQWSHVKMLGDEQLAHQKEVKDYAFNGEAKSASKRIEEYQQAVRANRQLSVTLRNQGLNEVADHFAYRAQRLNRIALRREVFMPRGTLLAFYPLLRRVTLLRRVEALGSYVFSWLLDMLAGYGYQPAKTLFWYLLAIGGFATAYAIFGHLPPFPDALVFSFMSFHGRGFFPSLSNETNLHNPLVMLAASEAVIGLLIEISLIATFTQRFFGR